MILYYNVIYRAAAGECCRDSGGLSPAACTTIHPSAVTPSVRRCGPKKHIQTR